MIKPVIPTNDVERVAALHSYNILNTSKEEEFDQITDLATNITGMPISLISLVDKDEVWFKSTKGMEICSSSRELSFCSHAVGHEAPCFVVNNTKKDEFFKDHPYANLSEDPILFYAGVCLIDKDGFKLGTLCVIDNKPNEIAKSQIDALQILASQVIKLIELHQTNDKLQVIQKDLENKNEELKKFAGVVSHDMKMPLANIIVTTDILKAKYASHLDDQALEYLSYLKQSSFTLSDYISGLLNHYESDQLGGAESFDIHHLLEEIVDLLNINFDCEIHFPEENIDVSCNRAALEQVFLNLIGNSLKYNDKEKIVISIEGVKKGKSYFFKVKDNGVGIPEEKLEDIFNLFTTIGNVDRQGNKGNGIGLSTVQKIIANLGGTITVASTLGEGTVFEFSVEERI